MDLAAILVAIKALPATQCAAVRTCLDAVAPMAEPESTAEIRSLPESHVRCFSHNRKIVGQCIECAKPVCDSCLYCLENHTIMSLEDVALNAFPSELSKKEVRALADSVQERIPKVYEETAAAIQAERDAERKANAHAEYAEDAGRIHKKDVSELARMRDELSTARARVDTKAAKAALANARNQLNVEARIEKELAHHSKDLASAKVALARARTAVCKLQGELARLEFVSGLALFPFSASDRAALAFASGYLGVGKCCSVETFTAFPKANAMSEVVAALSKPLQSVGPIQVGGPVNIGWLPSRQGSYPMASLSTCGVLCVGGDTSSLTVTHLPSKRSVTISCSNSGGYSHGFVYKRDLFISQQGQSYLKHAPVADVLAGKTNIGSFSSFSLKAAWGYSPRLDAAPRGFVAVANYNNAAQHLLVNLAERTSRLVNMGSNLHELGGFTGIDIPDVSYVTKTSSSSSNVCAVTQGSSKKSITPGMNQFPTVLPSAAAPADLARAAVFDKDAYFSVGGSRSRLTSPIYPYGQSLVRLYRDVFLCWDANNGCWESTRIVVP